VERQNDNSLRGDAEDGIFASQLLQAVEVPGVRALPPVWACGRVVRLIGQESVAEKAKVL